MIILLILAPVIASALITAAGCRLLRPWLVRYALARPNARSSHTTPTPQGGGIAMLIALVLVVGGVGLSLIRDSSGEITAVLGAALALGLVGGVDDLKPLPASVRLVLQALAVSGIVLALPEPGLAPFLPPLAERALIVLAGVWFVNLTNFMDGLDWLTVAGFLPMTLFLAATGLFLGMGPAAVLIAAALAGALIGFAPFNKPVARLFLGDVGSLPIGLIGAYLLYRLAGSAGLVPALILPLYHVLDASFTLLRRLARGERVWEAHRSHVYQQATDRGFSALSVSLHVLGLNLALCALALVALLIPQPAFHYGALALALLLTLALLRRFSTGRGAR